MVALTLITPCRLDVGTRKTTSLASLGSLFGLYWPVDGGLDINQNGLLWGRASAPAGPILRSVHGRHCNFDMH